MTNAKGKVIGVPARTSIIHKNVWRLAFLALITSLHFIPSEMPFVLVVSVSLTLFGWSTLHGAIFINPVSLLHNY